MAERFSQRPSQILKVHDEWAAYAFDSAVLYFGGYIEGKLAERDAKNNQKHSLDELLSDGTVEEADDLSAFAGISGTVRTRRPRSAIQVGNDA